ncbi:MAG: glycosyltransferase family 2 protein [Desulfobacterales bacterium]|nr:glycosyltransferase family 2 protein [Desulfobacterales bacterium]
MSESPVVSVIMGTYLPKADLLNRTIQSVLSQSFEDFEFIIIQDDNSPETTLLLQQWEEKDERIRFLFNQGNLGLIASLNRGLTASQSLLIARIDVGDTWSAGKLEKQIRCFDGDENLMVVGTKAQNFSSDGTAHASFKVPFTNEAISAWLATGRNPFIHSSVVFRKKEGFYYNHNALHTEDFELWCRYAFLGTLQNIEEVMTRYLIDESSISGKKRYLMYMNGTQVYRRYLINRIAPNWPEINSGFVFIPRKKMNLFQNLGSMIYTYSMHNRLKKNRIKGYLQAILSAIINPWFLLERLKRFWIKIHFSRYEKSKS